MLYGICYHVNILNSSMFFQFKPLTKVHTLFLRPILLYSSPVLLLNIYLYIIYIYINQGSVQYWPKTTLFLKKKGPKISPPLYSIPFLSVLNQNKALHNFHRRGQHPIANGLKNQSPRTLLDSTYLQKFTKKATQVVLW